MGLDAGTDIRALFMCWKLGSKERPGEFTREEFVGGMGRLGAQSIGDLKKKIHMFDPGFLDSDEYKDFFRWTFLFNLEGTKKTLEQEVVVELLPLAISDRSRFTKKFLEFLPTSNVSRISVRWERLIVEHARRDFPWMMHAASSPTPNTKPASKKTNKQTKSMVAGGPVELLLRLQLGHR